MYSELELNFYCLLAGVGGFCIGALFVAWLRRVHLKRQQFDFEHRFHIHVTHHRGVEPPERGEEWKQTNN